MQQQGVVKPSVCAFVGPAPLLSSPRRMAQHADYRCLNQVTRKDVYSLPCMDDIIDTLAQAKYFSRLSLDLFTGYWQVVLDAKSQYV